MTIMNIPHTILIVIVTQVTAHVRNPDQGHEVVLNPVERVDLVGEVTRSRVEKAAQSHQRSQREVTPRNQRKATLRSQRRVTQSQVVRVALSQESIPNQADEAIHAPATQAIIACHDLGHDTQIDQTSMKRRND